MLNHFWLSIFLYRIFTYINFLLYICSVIYKSVMIDNIYFIDGTIVIPFTGKTRTIVNECGYTLAISQIKKLNSVIETYDIVFNNPLYFSELSKHIKSIDNIYVYRYKDSYYTTGEYVTIQKTTNKQLSLSDDICRMFCNNELYGVKQKIYS